MRGLTSLVRIAAVLTAAGEAFACQSAHQPPRAAADPRVQPAARTLLDVCKTARENPTPRLDPHEDLDSILWQQTAAEYRANTTTVYRAAAAALSGLAAANHSGKEPVVVFDLDETVLDNSRFQGRLLAEQRKYDSDLWDCWVGQKQALLVPGTELLFRALVEQRVRARFITNRKCLPRDGEDCPQERETLENLNALLKDTGYVATPEESLLSAEKDPSTGALWDDEKKARREFVSKTHAIVMLVGDDLADFLEGVRKATIAARAAALEKVDDRWGKSWFLLPNPSYGSWVNAVDQEAAPSRKRPDVVKAFAYPRE
jgi:5'-nucleotidase (lipoprotein e(P4) family)